MGGDWAGGEGRGAGGPAIKTGCGHGGTWMAQERHIWGDTMGERCAGGFGQRVGLEGCWWGT